MKINSRLTFLFLGFSILPLLIVEISNYSTDRRRLVDDKLSALELIADYESAGIKNYFQSRLDDLNSIAEVYDLKTQLPILAAGYRSRFDSDYIRSKSLLDSELRRLQASRGYLNLFLVAPDGQVAYATDASTFDSRIGRPLPDEGNIAFSNGRYSVYISDIYRLPEKPSTYAVLLAAPVLAANKEFLGVVAIEVGINELMNNLQAATGLGASGEVMLVKLKDGKIIYLNSLQNDPFAALRRQSDFKSKTDQLAHLALSGKESSGLATDYRSKTVAASWRYIPSLNWGLAAKIDTEEILSPLADYLRSDVIFILVLILVVLLLARIDADIFALPIEELTRMAGEISKGNYAIRLKNISGGEEVGLLADSFNMMAGALARKEKDKYEFITSASHQLRTPTSGMKLQLSLLIDKIERSKKNKPILDVLTEIDENNSRALANINDMFKVLELGEHYRPANIKKLSVKAMVDKILDGLKDEIARRRLHVIADIPRSVTAQVDSNHFPEALLKIIENSIIYSIDGGQVEITAEIAGTNLDIVVRDDGIGIPQQQQPQIFEKFFRADNAYKKESVGTGLGLTIARIIVSGHGGAISFESVENQRTVFIVSIPNEY